MALVSAALALGCALAESQAAATASQRFVVVLDAAHGGDDNGAALGSGLQEKAVTLTLSVRLRSLLNARGFQVVTTREGNFDLDPNVRAQIANHARAAACLSLHATAAGSGVHIFVSSLPPAMQLRFMAWKTAQAAFVTRSLKLASTVNSAFERATEPGGNTAAAIPVTLGRTSLPGVDSMACPAVAVEVAPLRGADHKVVTALSDTQYQTQVIEALAAAVMDWRTDSETAPLDGGRQP